MKGIRIAIILFLAGALSIPIWRFSLDINPAFHYSFTNNFEVDGTPSRVRFSASAGISWLF